MARAKMEHLKTRLEFINIVTEGYNKGLRHWTELLPLEAIQLGALSREQFTLEKRRRFCEVMIEHYEKGMNEHPENTQGVEWVINMWKKSLHGG